MCFDILFNCAKNPRYILNRNENNKSQNDVKNVKSATLFFVILKKDFFFQKSSPKQKKHFLMEKLHILKTSIYVIFI
jgi:hypothetical protein